MGSFAVKKRIGLFFIISYLCLIFSACGRTETGIVSEVVHTQLTLMESTAVIDYIVPAQTPNVLIDKNGYEIGMENKAVIRGKRFPDSFRIVDASSREVVFEGEVVESKYHESNDVYVCFADFSDFSEEGTYYIECDYLGQSEVFDIKADLYRERLDKCIQEFEEKCQEKTVETEEIIDALTAFEWYPDSFTDIDSAVIPEILFGINDYFKAILGDGEYEFTMGDCVALAKFSFLYQNYDRQSAINCLSKAIQIYNKNKENLHTDSTDFYALTELYRASGQYSYRTQIEEQLPFFQNNTTFLEDSNYLYAAETYMFTRQKVDVNLCNIFMNTIKSRAEEVSERYEEIIAPLYAKNNGYGEILKRAEDIIFSNYILPNYHYNNILADFLHYLGGINYDSSDISGDIDDLEFMLIYAQLSNAKK